MIFAQGTTLGIGLDSPIHSLAASLSAKDPYLFSIDAARCEENLNKGVIPEELKEAFEIRGFSLPENANVSKVEKKDNRWDISINEKVIYNIKKEDGKIDIYDLIPLPLGLGNIKMPPFLRYSLSSIAAFLFFVSLLLHEMSHSYVAVKYGAKIHSITLHLFGGLAMMEDIPKDPSKEWRIAIAGPLMSCAIGGIFLLTFWSIRPLNFVIYPIKILVFVLGFLNVVLATFNLLPAFPMDGGRVLRAFLAKQMSFLKATRRAVLIGKIFAVLLAISGIFADPFLFLLTGEMVPGNIWIVGIAILLYILAAEEETATIIFTSLEGKKVKNVMRTERTSVLEDMPIVELANKMLEEKTAEYAVVNESGELKGFVTFDGIKKLSAEQRYILRVFEIMSSCESGDIIFEEEEAVEALKRMTRAKKNVLAVKREMNGNVVGIITRRDLAIYMEMAKESM